MHNLPWQAIVWRVVVPQEQNYYTVLDEFHDAGVAFFFDGDEETREIFFAKCFETDLPVVERIVGSKPEQAPWIPRIWIAELALGQTFEEVERLAKLFHVVHQRFTYVRCVSLRIRVPVQVVFFYQHGFEILPALIGGKLDP